MPNAFFFLHTSDAEIVFYASRETKKGEELTISFLGEGGTWVNRRERLVENVEDEGKRPEYSGVVGELKMRAEYRHQADFAVKGKKGLKDFEVNGK